MMQRLAFLFFLTGLVLMTSCAVGPQRAADEQAEAEKQFALGEYQQAAQSFLNLSQQGDETQRPILLLRASAAFARADNLYRSRQILKSITIDPRNPTQVLLFQLAESHIALMERRPDDVLLILSTAPSSAIAAPYLADYYHARAEAYTMLGNRFETARELVRREPYLSDTTLVEANQQAIWQALAMLSERALQQLRTNPPPDVLSGWMQLVQITKVYQLNPTSLKQALIRWQEAYPNHPVQPALLAELMERRQEDIVTPDNIALLLPLSGKFATAAAAVQDGFLAAYYSRNPKTTQTIRVYDTDSAVDILSVYKQAVNEGAQFIVGPLDKERIELLAESEELPVPTLALNYIDREEVPAKLYQFGLSPEEEAIQVAERTWLDGHVNAAVLVPIGPWGERVATAFETRWEEIGGRVVEQQSYNAARNDYSIPIRMLLNIDDSQRRYRSLANLLKQDLKFTARRRNDIDFIFLAAYPRQARQIRPQLKFYHASDLPVYATSHVFTGNLNPERDRDMDGLMFGDMPWVLTGNTSHRGLRAEIEPYISPAGNRLQRLYALGIDSFNIIPALSPLKQYPYQRYDGETGSLSLDLKQRLHRQLTWVRFRSGRPVSLDEAAQ